MPSRAEKKGVEAVLEDLVRRTDLLESKVSNENEALRREIRELKILLNALKVGISLARSAQSLLSYHYGDIARHAIEALAQHGPLNVSQLTKVLKDVRGTASRRIVAKKLTELEGRGMIRQTSGRRSEKLYELAKSPKGPYKSP